MKAKNITIPVLLLALAIGSYVLGYRNGQRPDFERREARGRLGINLRLYDAAQSGDLPKVQRDLGMVILGQTRTFEERYGAPEIGDPFAERLEYAQLLARQVESRLVRFDSPKELINAIEGTNAARNSHRLGSRPDTIGHATAEPAATPSAEEAQRERDSVL